MVVVVGRDPRESFQSYIEFIGVDGVGAEEGIKIFLDFVHLYLIAYFEYSSKTIELDFSK